MKPTATKPIPVLIPGEASALESGMIGLLVRDRWIRGIAVLMLLVTVPLMLPVFSIEQRRIYAEWYIEIPFLLVVVFALRARLKGVSERRQRLFWNLLLVAFVGWGLATVAYFAAEMLGVVSAAVYVLLTNWPYLIFYGALATALEVHPHVGRDPFPYPLRILNWAGAFCLTLGLLVYWLVVPYSSSEGWVFWASSQAFFTAMDAYLLLRLWHLRELATTHAWRWTYTWLLVAVSFWGFGDLLELQLFDQVLVIFPSGLGHQLVWPIALAAVVLSTRPTAERGQPRPRELTLRQAPGIGPLVLYALVPLVLHTLLYRVGSASPDLQLPREAVALAMTAVLGAVALAYHQLLRVENLRLTEKEAAVREQLAYQAFHDELTGLPNRNLFRDRLSAAIRDAMRYNNRCAVLFCDLDQFKVINDSLGHDAGDDAIVTTARRLRACVRDQDTVARLGGDEFAVILPGLHEVLDAAFLAEKFIDAIREPMSIGGKSHVLTTSIGIAVFPDDGDDEEVLLKHADTAMYQAKLHGRNSYRLFTGAMNEAAEERLAIEQGLRSGLMEDRFAVFYQPMVEFSTGRPVAFEALLRWNHPERGYIAPVNFIDVAEQTGLIVPIGKWVLRTACEWAAGWEGQEGPAPAVSVNMSARQFRDPELVTDIAGILQQTGLEPARLQVEISEAMVRKPDFVSQAVNSLRELGVCVAVDDFGTGYAALSRLHSLPVDIVKIDRSFVQGLEANSVSEAIVQAIVTMARALDFYVVAEGVETLAELEAVKQLQCNAAQGYYLCSPMPAAELADKLTELSLPNNL